MTERGQLVQRYAFGPGVDEPLVQYEGADSGSRTWLYGDQQGSIVVQAECAKQELSQWL